MLTFAQTALLPFVIAFKRFYCSSRDLIGCQNSPASVKSLRMFKSNLNSQLAAIYFAKLNQPTTSIYKSFGFYERHLLPKAMELAAVNSSCESFIDIESEKSVCYVCLSERLQATRHKTQTFTSTFDCLIV